MITVLAIIAVLASVTIPVSASFIRRGQHTNRTNIARNIYVLVQNQLTKSYMERTLKETLTGHNYELNASGSLSDDFDLTVLAENGVQIQLDTNAPGEDFFPAEEAALLNNPNVRFISKPRDYVPGVGAEIGGVLVPSTPEQDLFFFMLEGLILERDVLREAILMEYNILTGNVLSIFYGNANQEAFTYLPFDGDDIEDINSITGPRGMNEYEPLAQIRRQGYYGVRETGVPTPTISSTNDVAHAFDGSNFYPTVPPALPVRGERLEVPRPSGGPPLWKENVLYAEFILEGDGVYTFDLIRSLCPVCPPGIPCDNDSHRVVLSAPNQSLSAITVENFYVAAAVGAPSIYRDIARPVGCLEVGCLDADTPPNCREICLRFTRYIWLIDYIGEGGNVVSGLTEPENVRVRATRDGSQPTISLSVVNTLFARELTPGNFEIKSARHLNNVRHLMCDCAGVCEEQADHDADEVFGFRQTRDIDFGRIDNEIEAFAPLGTFRGTYRALTVMGGGSPQYAIGNLTIPLPFTENVGLFNENRGTIDGLMLLYPGVVGASGGALAGINSGRIERVAIVGAGDISNPDIGIGGGFFPYAGGIVGLNEYNGLIIDSVVRDLNITDRPASPLGGSAPAINVGAIAGENRGVNIFANVADFGIHRSAAEYSTVYSGGANIGGIVGLNEGSVFDVYFLSTHIMANPPISTGGGGIAGHNAYQVVRALYLAPAPTEETIGVCGLSSCTVTIPVPNIPQADGDVVYCRAHLFPITRTGNAGINCFYLAGHNYTVHGDDISRNNYNFSREGRFTVEGFELEDGSPDPDPENGLITDFFTRIWLETISSTPDEQVRFTNWKDPTGVGERPYRYPVLRTVSEPGAHPRVGERPVIEGDPPLPQLPNSIFQLDFSNGDFNAPLMVPAGAGTVAHPVGSTLPFFSGLGNHGHEWTINMSTPTPRYPGLHDTGNAYWIYFNQGFVQGWNTRPVQPSVYPNVYRAGPPLVEDWDNIEFQRPTTRTFDNPTVTGSTTNFHNGRPLMGYNGRMDTAFAELNAHVASTLYQICQTERPGFDPGQLFYYSFHHHTRTRDHANRTEDMSFFLTGFTLGTTQAPRGRTHAGYDVANLTLIRPCWSPRSQPGTAATRPATAIRESRYYNPSAANTIAYGARYAGTLEPYWSGSTEFTGANFGSVGGGQTGPFVYDVWIGSQGTGMTGTRDGFGITFWLNVAYCTHGGCTHSATTNCRPNLTGCIRNTYNRCSHAAATDCSVSLAGCVARNSSTGSLCIFACRHTSSSGGVNCRPDRTTCINSTACGTGVPGCVRTTGSLNTPRLDIRGYADLQALANHLGNANLGLDSSGSSMERLSALERRIFGYWDVTYGWKQYYGKYQVPVGQEHTEFAFQSHNVGLATAGNYLAGIQFNVGPSFLSITNSIRRGPDPESWGGERTPVSFVEPGNALTIHHLIENLGEVDAGTIIIQNKFSPFHELMSYEDGLTITQGGSIITPTNIQAPSVVNNFTLSIELPHSVVLAAKDGDTIDSIDVVFRVRVREYLLSESGISTWMYHIENQGSVGYSDVFGQYTSQEPEEWNHSNVSRVEISEVRLSKHICLISALCPAGSLTCSPASLIDGPFRVTLALQNTGEETASGIITDAIPHGFTIRNVHGAPNGFIRSISDSGINRQEHITFPNIMLGPGSDRIITYTIESMDVNNRVYGVAFASNARYAYGSEKGRANAMFLPQQVVGLTVKAENLILNPPINSTTTYDIISLNGLHDSSIIRYTPPIPPWMQADNYMVPLAELVLTHANGVPIDRDADNLFRVSGDGFSALLAGDSIVLTTGVAFNGTIHYRIVTTASKTGEADIPLSSEVRTITFSSSPS
jgi:hypothetical protein